MGAVRWEPLGFVENLTEEPGPERKGGVVLLMKVWCLAEQESVAKGLGGHYGTRVGCSH